MPRAAGQAQPNLLSLGASEQWEALGPQDSVLLDTRAGALTLTKGEMCLLGSPKDHILSIYLQWDFFTLYIYIYFFFTQSSLLNGISCDPRGLVNEPES